jgi:hypothetical protein
LLNPKPPDPEAAFAFQAITLPAENSEKRHEDRAAPHQETKLMSISRSTQTAIPARAAAFDFDVVSDAPVRPSRKPDPAPEAAPPEPRLPRETAKTAEA